MTKEELEFCIRRYGSDIFSFCSYLAGNAEDRDDLYQDTFLLALQKKEQIDPDQNVKSYLLSLSIGIWKNMCRKRKFRQMFLLHPAADDEQPIQIPDPKTDIEASCIEEEEIAFLREQISSLPDKYRIPVCLFYLEEMPQEEIARCMKLPVGTVKSRLNKARKILKERMEAAGYDR